MNKSKRIPKKGKTLTNETEETIIKKGKMKKIISEKTRRQNGRK